MPRHGRGIDDPLWQKCPPLVLGECDFHRTGDFGRITGVRVPRRIDGVTREADPLPPPPTSKTTSAPGPIR